jgi:hypothetical protein
MKKMFFNELFMCLFQILSLLISAFFLVGLDFLFLRHEDFSAPQVLHLTLFLLLVVLLAPISSYFSCADFVPTVVFSAAARTAPWADFPRLRGSAVQPRHCYLVWHVVILFHDPNVIFLLANNRTSVNLFY